MGSFSGHRRAEYTSDYVVMVDLLLLMELISREATLPEGRGLTSGTGFYF